MAKTFTEEDDALLADLGVDVTARKAADRTPREERILSGFEDIQRFRAAQGRAPRHGADRDIFERLYAVRLDRIRAVEECRALVEPIDHQGLLTPESRQEGNGDPGALADDALLAALAVDAEASSITDLKHVRSGADRKTAEEIANRDRCQDFATFKPLFEQVQQELDAGLRETRAFERKAEIETGRFFILGGQKAYIADVGAAFSQGYGSRDARLRVIFDNGTESNMLMRSLQRGLHKDGAGRRITDPVAGPLFADNTVTGDDASGTIYVLRSRSDLPIVKEHRDILHKIGVTGGSVERRIANANQDATYLLADVEVVATYELYNINRIRLENLLHRFFAAARLEIEITDRFGNAVIPREWFLIPLSVINETVEKIQNGTITKYSYDPGTASLKSEGQG